MLFNGWSIENLGDDATGPGNILESARLGPSATAWVKDNSDSMDKCGGGQELAMTLPRGDLTHAKHSKAASGSGGKASEGLLGGTTWNAGRTISALSKPSDAGTRETARVSVYVPSFNAERTLGACLQSILAQTVAFEQVLVIDDGSADGTADVASGFDVELVRNPGNWGLAATRNVGLSIARNPLVASVDSDCVLAKDWLETLLTSMKTGIGAVGGALFERHMDDLADLWRSKHLAQNWGPEPVVNPPFLFGCNGLHRREAVLSVGGYNEALTRNGEDSDISRKLKAKGWVLLYDPRARAFHLQRDSVTSAMARWWRWHNPLPKALGLADIAGRAPKHLMRALQYIRVDASDNPRLLLLDLAFPLAQVCLDVRAHYSVSEVRNGATGLYRR